MQTRTMTIEELNEIEEDGAYTWVSDWVLVRKLSVEAVALYTRMCFAAKLDEQFGDNHVTLTKQQADAYTAGNGEAAVKELLKIGAITKVKSSRGKTRFRLEDHSPEVRAWRKNGFVQAGDLPVVSYV